MGNVDVEIAGGGLPLIFIISRIAETDAWPPGETPRGLSAHH